MGWFVVKVAVSALLIALISEVGRRSTLWAAVLASLPLVSVLAMVWLYLETGDGARVALLSQSVFWLVLPSLLLFVVLAALLQAGWNFWLALSLSCAAAVGAYAGMVWLLPRLGIRF